MRGRPKRTIGPCALRGKVKMKAVGGELTKGDTKGNGTTWTTETRSDEGKSQTEDIAVKETKFHGVRGIMSCLHDSVLSVEKERRGGQSNQSPQRFTKRNKKPVR